MSDVNKTDTKIKKDAANAEPGERTATVDTSKITNPTHRAIEEIARFVDDLDHMRSTLVAKDVPFQTVNMLVEMTLQNRRPEREKIIDPLLSPMAEKPVAGDLTRSILEEHLESMASVERDLSQSRYLAREEGLDIHLVNFLAQIVRQNRGDGGQKAVNTFVAYAIACKIPLTDAQEMSQELVSKSTSVLPEIPRKEKVGASFNMRSLLQDVALGLLIGLGVMWLVV